MCSLIKNGNKGNRKAKVINEDVKKLKMYYKEYIEYIMHAMERVQSKFHQIGTQNINKIYLSCFDNKRYILDDRHYIYLIYGN